MPLIIFKYKYTGQKEEPRTCPKKYEDLVKTVIPGVTKFSSSGFNTQEIMKEWLKNLRIKLDGETRKVVLLLDSASQHKGYVLDALGGSNIQVLYTPGGCTSFLQPLDLTINKSLKEKIKAEYFKWLDSKQKAILKAQESRSNEPQNTMKSKAKDKIFTESGKLRTPEYTDFQTWFFDCAKSLSEASIKKSFASCGVTYGLRSTVNLDKKLEATYANLLDKIGNEKSLYEAEDPYGD